MKTTWYRVTACLMLMAGALHAQTIAGAWQGTLATTPRPLRLILQIAKANSGRWNASLLSIDQGGFDRPIQADSMTLKGSAIRVVFGAMGGTYEGVVSANGSAIKGTWMQRSSGPLDFERSTRKTAWRDASPHHSQFVTVGKDVRLEVLDWGGSGRPVVLLAGAGNSAHIFDEFAPRLTDEYHVYGITRRGFGFSSAPVSGYLADSLADDVLTVMDSLGIKRPVLVGHSIAGEELSSIGSRHPARVAGLVYLDAGYWYAYYDSAQANLEVSLPDVQRKLAQVFNPSTSLSVKEQEAMLRELLDTSLPEMERGLRARTQDLEALPNQTETMPAPRPDPVGQGLFGGLQKYTKIHATVLAIYAAPHAAPATAIDSTARAKADSEDLARVLPQIHAFERGIPTARVIQLPHAEHYVFKSNEADVLREIHAFVDGLPKTPQ